MEENVTIRTPGELLYKFNEAVWTKGVKGLVTVKGVYSKQDFEISDSRFIDKIVDEVNDARISVIVSESIRAAVSDGNVVVVWGYLDRYVDNKDGSIRLQLRVVGMDVLEQSSALTAKELELSSIRHKKISDGYKPVDSLLSEKLDKTFPRIALVYPSSSIVHLDFQREVGPLVDHYHFGETRVPFTVVSRLKEALLSVDQQGFDAVCLVRGGGSDFGALESPDLLDAVASMRTPVIAAVGHEDDRLFINEIADKYFSTPTSLGGYFRRLAEEADRREYKVKTLQEQMAIDRMRHARLRKWFIFVLLLLLVLVALAVAVFAGKIVLPAFS